MAGLLGVTGAAQHLTERVGEPFTVRRVRRLQYRGLIAYVKIGGQVRYDPADLDRFIEDSRRPAKATAS